MGPGSDPVHAGTITSGCTGLREIPAHLHEVVCRIPERELVIVGCGTVVLFDAIGAIGNPRRNFEQTHSVVAGRRIDRAGNDHSDVDQLVVRKRSATEAVSYT